MKVYTNETIPYTKEYFLRKKPSSQISTILIISTLIIITFIFISFAKFEEVIKISGFIRPIENISTVSNAVTGRIQSIEYKTGQTVKQGQLLLKIDPTQLEAEKENLKSQIDDESEKLTSLYEIKNSIFQNTNIIDKKHYEAFLRYELWETNLKKLGNIRDLSQKKYEQESNLPKSMTTITKLEELESEYLIACNNYDDYNISFKHEIEKETLALETSIKINYTKLKQIDDSILFTEVRAPIDGIIQEISVYNTNDWIQTGQKLFNIIPNEKNLTKVELSIPAKQAGKIETGMKVKMRFPSLPYHEFGGTEGNIITIDPDTIKSQNGDAYFIIITDIENQFLKDKKGKEYPLKVGLQVDARIILSKKTILNFVLEKMNLWY